MRYISGHYVFTGSEFIKNGIVEVDSDGIIAGLSSTGRTVSEKAGVEFYNGIIMPGLVNAHCHLELSNMKGIIPEHQGMSDFCKHVMLHRNINPDERYSAMRDADKFMENEGIVAVGDISNTEASIEVKKNSRLTYRSFIETFGLNPDKADGIIDRAKNLQKIFEQNGLSASITPHAPYSLSEKLLLLSVNESNNARIASIHNMESLDEMELFETKRGKMRNLFGDYVDLFIYSYDSSMQRSVEYIAFETDLLLIHNTFVNIHDLKKINTDRMTFVLCPASNLYIENRLPDINLFLENNLKVAVGTDGLSSNTNLSILNELKILNSHFPQIGLHSLLRWATLNGAQALKLDSELGSFSVNRRPGILLLSGIDFKNMQLTERSRIERLA
ncbi:MAG: amidohydrolase family protein [Prevotellaceae bacterium]|jgi:cytosine/adenosine deaminase-related metal-dependent hydrolase|nr:amidohydrolase family protein [Prevotellaceae bacterium]